MPSRNADVDNPERLEAEIRAAMFHHSRIRPDGFDFLASRRDRLAARAQIHAEIDDLLDRWATSRLLLALERISQESA